MPFMQTRGKLCNREMFQYVRSVNILYGFIFKRSEIFGVSDKPDEASVPNAEQAAMGMKALHHLPTVAVGSG